MRCVFKMDSFDNYQRKSSKNKMPVYFIMIIMGMVIGGFLVSFFLPDILDRRESLNGDRPPVDWEIPEEHEEPEYYEYQNTAVVKAAEKVTPSVVGITNMAVAYDFFQGDSRLQEVAGGSGVIIDSAGYIATNNHVIADADEIVVTLYNGEELIAEVIGTDPATDLAVLKIEQTGLPAASFSDSDKVLVGELAIAIGNPLGLAFQHSVTVGYISALQRSMRIGEQNFSFIQTDAAINAGNSGGPLVNAVGEVVGINTAKINITGVEGMGFAIPSNTVKKIVNDLIEHGRIIRPWIGIYIREIDEKIAEEMQLPVGYGLIVEEVISGGPAQKAGLEPRDIITDIEGEKIQTFDRLREVINQYKVGQKVNIKIMRKDTEIEVGLIFEEMP
ncbi:S1C family serine protease [Candidatus Contubernalis alkaliaceticus]|uniref:S1C family serine protease n=1 Tax=Candidatus Contubernalis alkaliaceticus TaxID=338645 RepID=UPI001F4C0E15|nr:trypsin-like peptidase domain-containing protein [Candidatus Contubernalis alkalaceticus]UNC93699.1 trypsin-like peptidase domain-containing protein [Candidatus Contubernalis alkalaceticus]